jgi:hypothetical protein
MCGDRQTAISKRNKKVWQPAGLKGNRLQKPLGGFYRAGECGAGNISVNVPERTT